jgi:hypothetical protein
VGEVVIPGFANGRFRLELRALEDVEASSRSRWAALAIVQSFTLPCARQGAYDVPRSLFNSIWRWLSGVRGRFGPEVMRGGVTGLADVEGSDMAMTRKDGGSETRRVASLSK